MKIFSETGFYDGAVIVSISALLFRIYMAIILKCLPIPLCVVERGRSSTWYNITASLTHSTLASIGSLYCFYLDPSLTSKIVEHHTEEAYVVACISLGYFIHDFIHSTQRPFKSAWEILLHHTVVIFCFGIAVVSNKFVNYAIVALLCEINSVFLHTRQLLNMAKVSQSSLCYQLNSHINIITYILFRICALSWMVRWLVLHKGVIPSVFHAIGVLGMTVMIIVNVILFARILSKDYWPGPLAANVKRDSSKTK